MSCSGCLFGTRLVLLQLSYIAASEPALRPLLMPMPAGAVSVELHGCLC